MSVQYTDRRTSPLGLGEAEQTTYREGFQQICWRARLTMIGGEKVRVSRRRGTPGLSDSVGSVLDDTTKDLGNIFDTTESLSDGSVGQIIHSRHPTSASAQSIVCKDQQLYFTRFSSYMLCCVSLADHTPVDHCATDLRHGDACARMSANEFDVFRQLKFSRTRTQHDAGGCGSVGTQSGGQKKLGKVITPDPWKSGARNTTEGGGRKVGENKALTAKKN
ncbi:hypothetical protein BaRGS_00001780, partial [Batillaria attramentaria]